MEMDGPAVHSPLLVPSYPKNAAWSRTALGSNTAPALNSCTIVFNLLASSE